MRDDDSTDSPGRAHQGGLPTWVVWGLVAIGLLALVALVVVATGVGGDHGPARHRSMGASVAVVVVR